MLMGVLLHDDGGVSICLWGCLYLFMGVSLHIGGGVSIYE